MEHNISEPDAVKSHRCNVIAVRHAQSEGNTDASIYLSKADQDIALTKKGTKQAEALAKKLIKQLNLNAPIFVYISPFKRTEETAAPFLRLCKNQEIEVNVIRHNALVERAWGELREKVQNHTKSSQDFTFFVRPEGGESFSDLFARVHPFLSELRKQHSCKEGQIILFTHGEWIKIARMICGNLSVSEFDAISRNKVPNCSITHLNLDSIAANI